MLDPEEEDGEVSEPGSKDKFDIKKIHDYPGFNVPASSRYIEVWTTLSPMHTSHHTSGISFTKLGYYISLV